jgi:predicted DNA-binding protein with PD1-like motif
MRVIRQPGPAPDARAVIEPCEALPCTAELPAGRRLLDALAALMEDAESGSFTLSGGALAPFGYVQPALSPDADHAAWYSAAFRPAGVTRWERGSVTLGWRDGAPFFHCHGIWVEADGARQGGHVLPEETFIAAPIRAEGVLLRGARFEAVQDAETGFKLFEPRPGALTPRAVNALALRLRPNQDITAALRGVAEEAGFARATLPAAVGSIIGARFADGGVVENFATEIFLEPGEIAAPLRTGLVDLTGALAEGVLSPGENPILMTLEAVVCCWARGRPTDPARDVRTG